jgi:hypothetical protein
MNASSKTEFAEVREELVGATEDYNLTKCEHAGRMASKLTTIQELSESRRRLNQAEIRMLEAENAFTAFVGARLATSGANHTSRAHWPTVIPARLRELIYRWTEAREYLR